MMIMRPNREPHITRSYNKLDEWLIIVVVTCYLFSVTTDAHERNVVKVVVRHGDSLVSLYYVLEYFVVVRQCFSRFLIPSEIVEKYLQCVFF